MKKVLMILFLAITVFLSCKKSNISPPILVGNWNWISTFNDGAPGPLNPLTPINSGITQFLTFTNATWVLTKNNLVVSSGTYTTSIAQNPLGENINRIGYYKTNNPTDSITYYSIAKDTLIFSYDYNGTAGSGASVYIKN
jgi:hypothetical protein